MICETATTNNFVCRTVKQMDTGQCIYGENIKSGTHTYTHWSYCLKKKTKHKIGSQKWLKHTEKHRKKYWT